LISKNEGTTWSTIVKTHGKTTSTNMVNTKTLNMVNKSFSWVAHAPNAQLHVAKAWVAHAPHITPHSLAPVGYICISVYAYNPYL
jgi:hypothetical protein